MAGRQVLLVEDNEINLEIAAALLQDVSAVITTAFREDVQSCLDSGMNAHVAKPFVMNDIISAYTAVLQELEREVTRTIP